MGKYNRELALKRLVTHEKNAFQKTCSAAAQRLKTNYFDGRQ